MTRHTVRAQKRESSRSPNAHIDRSSFFADFIWYQDNGPWSTRFTAWYLPGLLYRAEGDDVKNAIASIEGM